jgi:hypothetical protein
MSTLIDNALYDRRPDDFIILDFEGQPRKGGWRYPLCELIDGWVIDVDEQFLKMRDLGGKLHVYEKKSLPLMFEKMIDDSSKVMAIWLIRSGSNKKERLV